MVLTVQKSIEISQFQITDEVIDVLVVSVVQVPRVCAVKKTAETPQLQVVDVPVVLVVQAPLVQVRVVKKTVEDHSCRSSRKPLRLHRPRQFRSLKLLRVWALSATRAMS